jgi:hypothetical protein
MERGGAVVLSLEQRQRWRELILSALYDRTGGDSLNGLPSELLEAVYAQLGYPFRAQPASEVLETVKEELGEAEGPEVDRQIMYLEGEGLLRWEGVQIVLTHEGVRHVEERAGGEAAAVLPAVMVHQVEAFLGEVERKRARYAAGPNVARIDGGDRGDPGARRNPCAGVDAVAVGWTVGRGTS